MLSNNDITYFLLLMHSQIPKNTSKVYSNNFKAKIITFLLFIIITITTGLDVLPQKI